MEIIYKMNFHNRNLDVYGTVDNPRFLAADVAKLIDYSSDHIGQMLNCVCPDEKLTATIERSGQRREMWFLTEDGLFEVLFQSRKPIARRFKTSVKKILKKLRGGRLETIEDWMNQPDVYVDEWEQHNRENDEYLEFDEFLRMQGYTNDMLNN